MNSAYSFFIGWFIILLLFYGSTKFEGTKTLTYYALWLAVVLTLVTHYKTFISLIQSAVPSQQLGNPGGAAATPQVERGVVI